MWLLPSSTSMIRSTPLRWTVHEVSKTVCSDYLKERDAWFSSVTTMMQRTAFDLLVIEPYAQIVERLTYEAAKACFDGWNGRFVNCAEDDEPIVEEDFHDLFAICQRCDSGCIYWDELARLWREGHSLLVYQYIEDLSCFGNQMRGCQKRFAEIAPGGVLFDAVRFLPWYSSKSISFILAVQPQHSEMLVPRWRALPQKMGDGFRLWDGFMSFQDQEY